MSFNMELMLQDLYNLSQHWEQSLGKQGAHTDQWMQVEDFPTSIPVNCTAADHKHSDEDDVDNEVVSSDDGDSGTEIKLVVDEFDELGGLCEQVLAGEDTDTEETVIDHRTPVAHGCGFCC